MREGAAREDAVQIQEHSKLPVFQQAILDCDTEGVEEGPGSGRRPQTDLVADPCILSGRFEL